MADPFTVSVRIDLGNLPTLPERMDVRLKAALRFHIKDAAEAILTEAGHKAKDLPHPKGGPPVGPHKDDPGGYDTGRMVASFTEHLVEGLLESGVFYDLLSEDAPYWRWVEFGHWVQAKVPWYWEGYHLIGSTLAEHGHRELMRACRAAWHDAAIALAAEARTPLPGIHVAGSSPLLHR